MRTLIHDPFFFIFNVIFLEGLISIWAQTPEKGKTWTEWEYQLNLLGRDSRSCVR